MCQDAWLIKTDISGNEQWNKTFGGATQDIAYFVQRTSDGGYVLAGRTEARYATNSNAWLIKIDINGNEQWNKTFDRGFVSEYARSVQQTSDGGYILVGQSYTNPWLIKTDTNGNKLWDKIFGGVVAYDYIFSVQQTLDGGYILAGQISSFGAGSSDAWLIKTDANGNEQWNKTFGGIYYDFASSVQQTSDNGYILAGETRSYGDLNGDAWLVKTDVNGNQLWARTIGGINSDAASFVQQTSDGYYILAGSTRSYGAGNEDSWLVKTDAIGNEFWNRTFGGVNSDRAFSVQQTSDGGYAFVGNTESFGAGYSDAWLVKVSSDAVGPTPTPSPSPTPTPTPIPTDRLTIKALDKNQ